eukprot:3484884-Pyramimonas_sp.AAC.1
MSDAVSECVHECGWRLQALLRSRRCRAVAELVVLYKARILSFIEYRTPAFSCASNFVLLPLDRVQAGFLRARGITEHEALRNFNLAPLAARRDIAKLGLIHRAVLGFSPPCIGVFFSPLTPPFFLPAPLAATS